MFNLILANAGGPGGISLAWSIPFAVLLAAIALMPLLYYHWWEKHYAKVAIALALIPAIYYFLIVRQPLPWLHAMEEYISFIILLSSLYVISGGINIRVNRLATPLANCTLLLIGSMVANLFGTTGASMLLIRPFIRMNRDHIKPYHVVFFIFTIANCGGLLTPIGDPPLFLGYLSGVPFRWTFDHLWPIWGTCTGILLAIFFVIDTLDHRKTHRPDTTHGGPQVHILGIHNFIFIAAIIFAVFRPGVFETIDVIIAGGISLGNLGTLLISREVIMIAAMVLSRRATSAEIYQHNEFSYAPIREVAILFIGIFSTMAPALGWLGENADKLRLETPGQFYFTSGSLSAVLDNAPTYLTFLQIRVAELDAADVKQAREIVAQMKRPARMVIPSDLPEGDVRQALDSLIVSQPARIRAGTLSDTFTRVGFLVGVQRFNEFIIAISAGAVLFGAMTYIGNGPNFMVKSIADASGIKTPSFLGYIFKYSLPILGPLYILIWLIFL